MKTTIIPDDLRTEIKRQANHLFGNAASVAIHYHKNGAFLYVLHPYGMREMMYLSYEAVREKIERGQHECAMRIIGSIPQHELYLQDSINYYNY